MQGEWNFYACLIEDMPASIFLDLSLIGTVPLPGFDRLGYLRLYMNAPRPDGLSSNDEFDRLVALEDQVLAQLEPDRRIRYVGRDTANGARTYYFYLAESVPFEDRAAQAMAAHPEYAFDAGEQDDPDWRVYRDFLYPRPRDLQAIRNRDVLQALRGHGDHLELPRPIDHWAYFPDAASAEAFAAWAEGEGFHLSPPPPSSDGSFGVRFDRIDQPDAIDSINLPLVEKAKALGGDYDGWECQVIRP